MASFTQRWNNIDVTLGLCWPGFTDQELQQGHVEEKETQKKPSPIHPAGLLPYVHCSNFSNLLGAPSLSIPIPLSLRPTSSFMCDQARVEKSFSSVTLLHYYSYDIAHPWPERVCLAWFWNDLTRADAAGSRSVFELLEILFKLCVGLLNVKRAVREKGMILDPC